MGLSKNSKHLDYPKFKKEKKSKPIPPKPVGLCGPYVWVVSQRPDMRHGAISRHPMGPYAQELYDATMRKWR